MPTHPLIQAVGEQNIEKVRRLVNAENVNMRSDRTIPRLKVQVGDTPLIIAARRLNPELVTILIEAGANVNESLPNGDSAIHMIVRFNHQYRYHLNSNDYEEIVLNQQIKTLKALLAAPGIDVDKPGRPDDVDPDSAGLTVLERAILGDQIRLIGAILDAGADIERVNADGFNPLEYVLNFIRHTITTYSASPYINEIVQPRKEKALFLIRRGANVRPEKMQLLQYLTESPDEIKNMLKARANQAWERRRHLTSVIMAKNKKDRNEMANSDATAGAATGAGAADEVNYSNLPPLVHVGKGNNVENQGGGRRRSMRKRKASKKTRRSSKNLRRI